MAPEAAAPPLNDAPVLSDGDFAVTDFGRSHRARTTVADAIAVYELQLAQERGDTGRAA